MDKGNTNIPDFEDVLAAGQRISALVEHTEVRTEPALNEVLGCRVWLKCENQQPTGAFKLRGASNAIAQLRNAGITTDVATHSSGNHGAALALAAQRDGRTAHVVMPRNSVPSKIASVKRHGGQVMLCEPGQEPREKGLQQLVDSGLIPIPPYDHPDIIAGQGTAALELLNEVKDLDCLITPLGGGGLLAGSALAARTVQAGCKVYGAEPAGAADAHASLKSGTRVTRWQPDTIADGLRAVIGIMNFELIQSLVDDILLVSETAIIDAMKLTLETTGMTIEPSSAVAVAAIQCHPDLFRNTRTGVILTGQNVDYGQFDWLPEPAA